MPTLVTRPNSNPARRWQVDRILHEHTNQTHRSGQQIQNTFHALLNQAIKADIYI